LTTGGLYKIAYRVVSADGHPVSGQLTFTYAPPGSNLTVSHQGRKPATGAADGHGAHYIALGILVLAAVAASVIALRKDRQYDRAAASTTPATLGEATPGAVSTGAPDTAASDTAVPDSAVPDSAAADPATGNGAKKQPAR
jgi:copper resistance protein C